MITFSYHLGETSLLTETNHGASVCQVECWKPETFSVMPEETAGSNIGDNESWWKEETTRKLETTKPAQ